MRFILINPLLNGVGASTIAANLSYCLSKEEKKVLLIQANGSFSSTDVLLDLPRGEIPGWRTSDASLEDLIWKIFPSLYYLPAGRGDSLSIEVKAHRTGNELIQSIRDLPGYEWIILDGFDRQGLLNSSGELSDIALYVVEPNSSGMEALSEFRKTKDWSVPGTYCVVNKFHPQSRLEQDLVKLFRNFLQEKFCPLIFSFDEIALRAALRKEFICKNFSFTDLGGKFHDLSTWVKLQFVSGAIERGTLK